jgi:hypothetical protein
MNYILIIKMYKLDQFIGFETLDREYKELFLYQD